MASQSINIDFRIKGQNLLSNMMPRPFVLDGIKCGSTEGVLMGGKIEDPGKQKYVCSLSGWDAQRAGKDIPWWETQTLYWKGKAMDRHGPEYQEHLDRLYANMYAQNPEARKALMDTYPHKLIHKVGGNDPTRTILTVKEFCGRLMDIRQTLVQIDMMQF